MANQQSLNQLLHWSIENSSTPNNTTTSTTTTSDPSQPPSSTAATTTTTAQPTTNLNPELLAQLLGGPSDADLMIQSMQVIIHPSNTQEEKLVAWDNFEQLIENLDNANMLSNLKLWDPLVAQLHSEDGEMRRMSAWCCATAVQNNIKAQEALLSVKMAGGEGVVKTLVGVALRDEKGLSVRKKAVTALSAEVRNFQPGLDELERVLVEEGVWQSKGVDAADMEAVDEVIQLLRDHAAR